MLNFTEESLNFICRKITIVNPETEPTVGMIAPKSSNITVQIP
jgi:hypothetical protein